MAKYKCDDCGATFDHDELIRKEACIGEFWGSPAYETEYFCPNCQSQDFHDLEDDDEETN